jgi:WD40 repeat protein
LTAVRTLRGHVNSVYAVSFSPDGQLLASASADNTIKLWNPASGAELRSLSGHKDGVLSVAFSPDGRMLASAGRERTVKLWDVASGRQIGTYAGAAPVVFSPKGGFLAATDARTIKLWKITGLP